MNNRKEINEAQANEMFPNIMETLKDNEKILNNVYPVAIKTLDRYEGIEELIYDEHDGYYVIYKLIIDEEKATASAAITERLIKAANITDLVLRQHAWINLQKKIEESAECISIEDILRQNIPNFEEIVENDPRMKSSTGQMYVLKLGNENFQISGILGKFNLLSDTVFKMFPMSDKVIVLPSSIWELLIIPVDIVGESFITEQLTSIVKDINGAQVDPREQVADKAYLLTRSAMLSI